MSHTLPTLSSTPVQTRKTTVSPLTSASTTRHKLLGRISDNGSSPTMQQNQSSNKEKQLELVTVAGSSIVKGLGNGTIDFSNKSFGYHVHTKHGAGIERMTEFMKEKHFKPSPRFIVCVGTTSLKYDKPSDALPKEKKNIDYRAI
ncbi:unnamed protein product [Didymodactylos carnosus]|uniref:Uncharacterized protein n=1 Tax=Didymodactylos carnosus TaxID=1234261 RepID=A0A8S2MT78_9BILA|nr:unnamed protein product [Didymodactylos carnosus]CAF3964818.1 unnamed protein product [Didymodactylos carnosus]